MAETELADAVMLTSGAMTNRIDRLEDSGLISRVSDEEDRGRVLVQLTDDGLKLIECAAETRFQSAVDAIEGVSLPCSRLRRKAAALDGMK